MKTLTLTNPNGVQSFNITIETAQARDILLTTWITECLRVFSRDFGIPTEITFN